ncbi:MAG TPA: formimidoylglutamate deiminase [Steroidobacteraceae bacterium]|nr:formimidoylglutamate deiminase [Steroidobacteraceae bacterium]
MEPHGDLFASTALLPEGWVDNLRIECRDGRIARLERGANARAGDERVGAVLPGMPNLHSHAFQRGMAGLTEYRSSGKGGLAADNFWSWRSLMYRFVGRMTPEDFEAVTTWAFVEMLEAGFTRVGEFHYVHHDTAGKPYADPAELTARVIAAAENTGIALTWLPVFYAQGGFGGAPANEGQKRFLHDVPAYARLLESGRKLVARLQDAVVGIAPHSLRAVTPEQLKQLLPLAGQGPIHMHAAEQVGEVEQCLAWSGARPVQWLLDHAPVDERWCLVHSTHLDDAEITRFSHSGAVAGLCPITEANLGDGIFPATKFLAAGGRFGIGTDSNVSIDVRDELRQLEYSQRLRDRARNVVARGRARDEAEGTLTSTGRALFAGALAGGSQALGVARECAGIIEGAPADFFSLNERVPLFAERKGDALLDSLVFAGVRDAIDGVWRAGRKVVVAGRHALRDPAERAWRTTLARLLQ